MTDFASKYAKCPYYKSNAPHKIRCESFTENGDSIDLVFANNRTRSTFQRERCNSIRNCRLCPIHKLLDEKYEYWYAKQVNNIKALSFDGEVFDSRRERDRYSCLALMQRAGEISGLIKRKLMLYVHGVKVREV